MGWPARVGRRRRRCSGDLCFGLGFGNGALGVVLWTKYMSIYGAYKRMKANTHCYHLPHRKDRGRNREAAQAVTHHLSNFSSHIWDT